MHRNSYVYHDEIDNEMVAARKLAALSLELKERSLLQKEKNKKEEDKEELKVSVEKEENSSTPKSPSLLSRMGSPFRRKNKKKHNNKTYRQKPQHRLNNLGKK